MNKGRAIAISNNLRDVAFSMRLNADLRNMGVNIALNRTITPSNGSTPNPIANAAVLIPVITQDYLDDPRCHEELNCMATTGRPIVAVVLNQISALHWPFHAGYEDYVDFQEWSKPGVYQERLEQLFTLLVQAVPDQINPPLSPKEQYINSLIAQLETTQAEVLALDAVFAGSNTYSSSHALVDSILTGQFEVSVPFTEDIVAPGAPAFETDTGIDAVVARHRAFVLTGLSKTSNETLQRALMLEAAYAPSGAAPLPMPFSCALWQEGQPIEDAVRQQWPLTDDPITLLHTGQAILFVFECGDTARTSTQIEALKTWFASSSKPQFVIMTCRAETLPQLSPLQLPTVQPSALTIDCLQPFLPTSASAPNAQTFLPTILNNGQHYRGAFKLPTLAEHPYLLAMFDNDSFVLESSAEHNFGAFVNRYVLHRWQLCPAKTMRFALVKDALSSLAFQCINDDKPVFVSLAYAKHIVGGSRILQECAQTFLTVQGEQVRFTDELFKAYFAAHKLVEIGWQNILTPPQFDPSECRIPSKWDAALIVLAGLATDPNGMFETVIKTDPFLAFGCAGSGMRVDEEARERYLQALVPSVYVHHRVGRNAVLHLLPAINEKELSLVFETMRDGNWDARWEALESLLGLPSDLDDVVIEALDALSDDLMDATVASLRTLGSDALLSLVKLAKDSAPEIRRRAIWALGQLDDRAAVPVLVDALFADEAEIITEAATALGWLRDHAADLWLKQQHYHDTPEAREAVRNALFTIDAPDTVESMLVAATNAPSDPLRDEILTALSTTPIRSILENLQQATNHPDPAVHSAAIAALDNMEGDVSISVKRLFNFGGRNRRAKTPKPTAPQQNTATQRDSTGVAASPVGNSTTPHNQQEGVDSSVADENNASARRSAKQAKQRLQSTLGNRKPATAPQISGLNAKDWTVRRDTVNALQNAPEEQAVPLLLNALEDPDSLVRVAAVTTLQHFQSDAAIRGLVAAMANDEVQVSDAASAALANLKRIAIPYLVKALTSSSVNQRTGAVEALGKIGDPDTIKPLSDRLNDTERGLVGGRICDLAAKALEDIGTPDALFVVLQWKAENASDPREAAAFYAQSQKILQDATAQELSNSDVGGRQIVHDLLHNLRHATWPNSQNAAKSLIAYANQIKGVEDPVMIQMLVEVITDPNILVRSTVINALGWIGDPAAIPALIDALQDDQSNVRINAVHALMEIKGKEAVAAVVDALEDHNEQVREAAADALGYLGDSSASFALLSALEDTSEFVQIAAIYALGRLKDYANIGVLETKLKEGKVDIRWAAAVALGDLGAAEGVPALIEALNDCAGPYWEESQVCEVAAKSLEIIGTPEALAAVIAWKKNQDLN